MWQLIDSRTIVLACAVAGMALSVVTYLIWRAGVTCPGFGRWTAAVALTVISSCLVGLRGVVPDWLSIVAGNFCSVASLILYGEGLHQFHGRRRSPWMFWLAGLFAASLAYFRYVQDSLAIRVFLTAATMGGGAVFYALPLTRTAFRGRSAGARVVVIALWWLVLGSTFRLLGILRNPGQTDLYSTNTAGLLGLVLYLVVAPCLPIGCVLAAYERLVVELRETNANMLLETEERHNIERRLARAERLEAVGRLAGGVAHNLNNLMCVVKGYSALLLDKVGAAHPFREPLEAIQKAGDQTVAMTAHLLAFARAKALRETEFDLAPWIEGVLPRIREVCGERVRVETRFPAGPLAIRMDSAELEHAILILARNAKDAMPGGGALTIAAAPTSVPEGGDDSAADLAAGDYVRLSIADTGTGMDEATRARVFEPFFTTKGLASAEGLGLSGAFGMMRQSGGTLTVESAPGQGSTFHLYLPAASNAAPKNGAARSVAAG